MLSHDGVTIISLVLLTCMPIILLGADYLFDEILKVKAELRYAPHYRAFLYLSIISISFIVIVSSRSSYSYFETFRITGTNLIWVLAIALCAFYIGKSVLQHFWSSKERDRIERLDLELPQYLEMFHILITSGMSVLSALKVLSHGSSSLASPSRLIESKEIENIAESLPQLRREGQSLRVDLRYRASHSASRSDSHSARRGASSDQVAMGETRSEVRAVVQEILRGVEEGLSIERALDQAVMRAGSEQLRRFGDAVILGMERGSSMGQTLRNLINETRTQSKVLVMQRAGKAEIKLLIPVVFLILPISVIFAIWPSYMNLASIMGG